MSLCTYSSETHSGSFLVIENTFINNYLPSAPEFCIKVYLYGLYLCSTPSSIENTIDNMMHTLSMSASEIRDAFEYWQGEGLVQILDNTSTNEISIKYLPVHKKIVSAKKYANKYAEFNSKLQAKITSRMIPPSEYNEYYTLLQSFHMDEEAFLNIVDYCIKLKGENVGYPYIVAVAKNFANEGYKSTEAVNERLNEHFESNDATVNILKVFKPTTKHSTIEERNLYIKWTTELNFTHDVIKYVAKDINKKGGNLQKLDKALISYYNAHTLTIPEIEKYNKSKQEYLEIAKTITRNLGTYYENLDIVIETYITDWIQKGYEKETLEIISSFCFKRSTKTLEGMNNIILKLYKLGLVSQKAIVQYIDELKQSDAKIQEILDSLNILRSITNYDREAYQTWTTSWNFSTDIIKLVATYSASKSQPIQYMNKLLSSLFEAKITALNEAETHLKSYSTAPETPKTKKSSQNFSQREYNAQELEALWGSLDNVEI